MKDVVFILIPGLNDQKFIAKQFYQFVMRRWRKAGMKVIGMAAGWKGNEEFSDKKARLAALIEKQHKQGRGVVLVGVSAGASLAIAVFGDLPEKVVSVVSVSGFLKRGPHASELMSHIWYQSAEECEKVIARLSEAQKRRILAFFPQQDKIVNPKRAQVPGAKNQLVPISGHVRSIVYTLVRRDREIREFSRRI